MNIRVKAALAAAVLAVCVLAVCGPEISGPGSDTTVQTQRTTEVTAPAPGPPPVIGAPAGAYEEYFAYSAHVRRSFVPGYTPHATSLFENPRVYPNVLCVMGTPYFQYAGINGWFFGSPRGYQTSVPPGSHALAYFRGELGITSRMKYGYPEGLRVVEPVIVPFGSYNAKGGTLINNSGGADVYPESAEATTFFPERGKMSPSEERLEVLAIPTPTPAPGQPATAVPLPAPTLPQ